MNKIIQFICQHKLSINYSELGCSDEITKKYCTKIEQGMFTLFFFSALVYGMIIVLT